MQCPNCQRYLYRGRCPSCGRSPNPTGRLHANEPELQNIPVRADARNVTCLFCHGPIGTPFPTHGQVACLTCVHKIVDFWAIGFLRPEEIEDHYLVIHGMPRRQEFTTKEGA